MNLSAELMVTALKKLDEVLPQKVSLVLGGGGAMLLAHKISLVTSDLDAVPRAGITMGFLDPFIKRVGEQLSIPGDWMNPYFSTFSHSLPSDYEKRLINVFQGEKLAVDALSKEEMLIMKCFAHRPKDVGHARSIIRLGVDFAFVEKHIESLLERNIPGAKDALDFLDDLAE